MFAVATDISACDVSKAAIIYAIFFTSSLISLNLRACDYGGVLLVPLALLAAVLAHV